MANGNGWLAPKTETPFGVIVWLLGITTVLIGVFCYFAQDYWVFGLIASLLILGVSTKTYTQGVPQYYAVILMDNFFGGGSQRVIFQGVHLKLPWESPQLTDNNHQIDFINLRTEVKGVIKDETYPTCDGLVVGTYVFTMKINTEEKQASGNVLRWASYDSDAVLTVLRAIISRTFSSFCQQRKTDELINMDNESVNEQAFPPGKLTSFEQKYGVEVSVTLEDLDRDSTLQKAKDTIAQAKSYAEALETLAGKGMSPEAATQFLKLINFPDSVKEQTFRIDVTGLDLSNLQHFNFLGVPKTGGTTGGGKK